MEDQIKAIAIIIAILILSSYPYICDTISKIRKYLGLSKKKKTTTEVVGWKPNYSQRENIIKENTRRERTIEANSRRKITAQSSPRIFSEEILQKVIVNSEYFMSIDLQDQPTYCFGRKIGDQMEFLLTKTIRDQKAFELEVDNLVKYFDATIVFTTK